MLELSDIEQAYERIKDQIYLSPCAHSEMLSKMLGCQLYLKLDNLQMTGSFKERGALNKILQLSDEQKSKGVIAASAGNHAQAVAHAAKLSGIQATIVMPETTPLTKIRGTEAFGAKIVLHGDGFDAAFAKAAELQKQHDYTLIHAFDDDQVIAGQGTLGLELLQQVPDMDVVVVPIGGGGLISGIATAIKSAKPNVRVVGVEASLMPAMTMSVKAGKVKPWQTMKTIADGIAVATVGSKTLPIVQALVSDIVTVSEDETAAAIMTLLEREKTLAEGAGAVGFAALSNHRVEDVAGKKVVVVISGGNIDMSMLSRILERGLESDGRLANMQVIVSDKPGSIAQLATLLAEEKANILHISQTRSITEVQLGETEVELTLETRGQDHVEHIKERIRAQGYMVKP
jgi:threonine dehydratase